MFLRLCLTAASLAALPVSAKPDAQIHVHPELVAQIEYGLICYASEAVRVPAPGTISGAINQRDRAGAFVLQTQSVPMAEGVSFGVQITLQGETSLYGVTVTIHHPPHTDRQIETESWTTDFLPDAANGGSFTFEYDYEQTPGLWTMTAEHDGEMIYDVSFDVVAGGNLPNFCNVEPLLG